ncbi:hypothetical protein E2C01_081147 [Portunus trituberculatus]|uniref:Uncharacterized protein n=1 Tax=Portunus trituberculatus TaxID=210409 RepID=A0A5B7J1G7_PORTR|nr:hypothetical protein [Portunus trituberculatus]
MSRSDTPQTRISVVL